MVLRGNCIRGITTWLVSSFALAPAFFVGCAAFAGLSGLSVLLRERAHAQPATIVGNYQASAAAIRSEVSAWGVDCGVQPQSYTASERPLVSVGLAGSHLVLSYPDRRLRTDLCWSPNPLVKLASATAADNRWRAECRTPRGEAKQEVGRYTVTATGPYTLELIEESDYDWQLKGSHCLASVRITQMLERVPQERAAPVEAKPAAATPTKTPVAPCVAGALTRLRIRPSEARIEPGQRVCFTVQGMDAAGCAADVEMTRVRWELKKPDAARAHLGDGCFRAAASAADGEGSFRVSAIHEGLRAEASVSVLAPDLSDITAPRGTTTAPEGTVAAAEPAARGMEDAGVKAATVKQRDPTVLWLSVGAAGLALLGAGLFIVTRLRAKPALPTRRSAAPTTSQLDPVSLPPSPPAPSPIVQAAPITQPESARPAPIAVPAPAALSYGSGEQLICPTCRRGYAPGAQRCTGDDSELVPYADFVRRAKEAETTSTTCPSCGAKLAAASVFCGGCGSKLTS